MFYINFTERPIFITSQRGKQLILYGGYKYAVKRVQAGCTPVRKTWHCSTHNCRSCKATLITVDNIIVHIRGEHNHGAVEVKKVNTVFEYDE